jgi:squalene-associated FAD-dependent desaturase
MCDVLVIGGGWAGISAAVDAAKRGATVVLVEERPYLGGRARSFTDKTTGEEIDNGQHLMMGCYASTLSVLRELSTDGMIHRQDALRVRFIDADGRQDLLDAGLFPGAAGVAAGIMRLRHLSTRSRLKILDLAVRLRMGRVVSADLTCENFLLRYGQTSEAITRFWEPIILATLNAPIGQAAADLLVAVMRLAFLGGAEDSKLYLPTVGLSELIAPFPSWLARHGGSVHTSTSCDEIRIENSRVTEVVLSNGQTLRPSQVVAAVPERSLTKLNAQCTMHSASSIMHSASYSPIISIYLWYDKAFMEETFVAALGTTTQWVFDRRRIQRSVSADVVSAFPGHVALTMSAGSSLAQRPAEEIIEHCDTELRQLFRGRMEGVRRLHGLVIKEKMATPLITPRTERPVLSALHGTATNLWVAGDWTDTGLPATIEGASRSGVAAARAALPV